MPQFPDWKQQLAAWTPDVTQVRGNVNDLATELADRGRQATDDAKAKVAELAGAARNRVEQLPQSVLDQARRRLNVLDLATKRDVEVQNKLAKRRLLLVMNEFREEQRGHDLALVASLKSELREQLQSLASALDDEAFDVDAMDELDEPLPSNERRPARSRIELDYLTDEDDDIDLTDEDAADIFEANL